jgi:hypothetical protein
MPAQWFFTWSRVSFSLLYHLGHYAGASASHQCCFLCRVAPAEMRVGMVCLRCSFPRKAKLGWVAGYEAQNLDLGPQKAVRWL